MFFPLGASSGSARFSRGSDSPAFGIARIFLVGCRIGTLPGSGWGRARILESGSAVKPEYRAVPGKQVLQAGGRSQIEPELHAMSQRPAATAPTLKDGAGRSLRKLKRTV